MSDLRAVATGDPAAVDAFYRAWAPHVLRWVIRLGGPHLDAEDVAQDALVVAIKRAHSFAGRGSVRAWVFGVTRGVVRNARRRAALRRFIGLDQVAEPASGAPGADELVHDRERRRQVQRALDRLSTAHREAIVLVDLEGLTAPEAAEALGIAAGTVYSRVHHARKRLRDALIAEGFGDAPAAEIIPFGRRS